MTEVKIHCAEKEMTSDRHLQIRSAVAGERQGRRAHVMTGKGQGQSMHMDFDFTSKYLGASCGDVKVAALTSLSTGMAFILREGRLVVDFGWRSGSPLR